jgi:hypothetical protein
VSELRPCPLCDDALHLNGGPDADMAFCNNAECVLDLRALPLLTWRAIAALRKPMTDEDAQALVTAVVDAEWCGITDWCEHPRNEKGRATCGDAPRAALVRELTGKKP